MEKMHHIPVSLFYLIFHNFNAFAESQLTLTEFAHFGRRTNRQLRTEARRPAGTGDTGW